MVAFCKVCSYNYVFSFWFCLLTIAKMYLMCYDGKIFFSIIKFIVLLVIRFVYNQSAFLRTVQYLDP